MTAREMDKATPEWDASQVEPDRGESDEQRDRTVREHAAAAERAHWDKGQVAEETEDGRRTPHIGRESMKEGESALSGERTNPGGGERWAERQPGD